MNKLDEIKADRSRIYGDPKENHKGIAKAWAGLLEPHAKDIARGEPVPPHTVALMMAALKMNRMRRVYHADNYDDIINYLEFAREWQSEHRPTGPAGRLNIYVAAPYSNGGATTDENARRTCVYRARAHAMPLVLTGHHIHLPLDATHELDCDLRSEGIHMPWDYWLEHDFNIIRHWADAVFRVPGPSKGADAECDLARKLNLPVYHDYHEIPDVGMEAEK